MGNRDVSIKVFTKLHELFPEAEEFVDELDKDNITLILMGLTDWLESVPDVHNDRDIIDRLEQFHEWVWKQERGERAGDDIFSMYVVSFLESLLRRPNAYRVVTRLFSKEDMTTNSEYLAPWVGQGNIERTLAAYED